MKFILIVSIFASIMGLSLYPARMVFAQDEETVGEENFDENEDFNDTDVKAPEEAELEAELETAEPPIQDVEPKDAMPAEEADDLVAPLENESEKADEFTAESTPYIPPNDDPDLNYEAKLHDIFLNFYNSKTPEAEWNTLVGTRHSERYRIQGGDNLWDISKTLFGDGNYWPKVWSLNSNIKNPHLISPNNSIRFLLGDESEPPSFAVTENATETPPPAISNVDAEQNLVAPVSVTQSSAQISEEPEPEIPPPLKVSRPVVKKLPPSLPEWQDIAAQGNYDEFGISYNRRKIADVEDTVPLASYIAETVPEYFGVVNEIEVGHNMASAYQYIYVSMKKGVANIGDTFLAVANRGEIQSVNKSIKGFLGFTIDIQGEVQLVERVAGRNESKNGEMFRALVLNIVNPVGVGSILTNGKIENIELTEQGPRSQVVAQVIGGSFFVRRQVYGNESITYLNRGENDGLQVGQILPVRANRQIRNSDTQVLSNIRPIGWIRIVKTTPRFATGVIVRAWSDVLSGDLTGSGDLLPQMGVGSAATAVSDSGSSANLQEEMDSDDGELEDADIPEEKSDVDENVDF